VGYKKVNREKNADNIPRISLIGAAPGTANLGVSALCNSTIAGFSRRLDRVDITVFDFGRGSRKSFYKTDSLHVDYNLCGQSNTRRYYSRDSLWNMRVSAWLGGLGNPGVEIMRNSCAVIDISGGDSFTDLYGKRRFDLITLPKLITLQLKRPLVLLPQTYGPFNDPGRRKTAQNILRNATAAWARDDRSFDVLCEMLGNSFDSQRHHKGVDVAFSLPVSKPEKPLSDNISELLVVDRNTETIGFNVSGLIFSDPTAAKERYGFKADYRKLVVALLRRILAESDVNIILIPHVNAELGSYESDPGANLAVMEQLADVGNGRIEILSPDYNESEVKWVISQLDWFCGTRMHSTIAGLSTGVPTTAIAYSLKTQGVFETCGQGNHVVDPRYLCTEDVIEAAFESFQERLQTRKHLNEMLPAVKKRAEEQMDNIVSACIDNR